MKVLKGFQKVAMVSAIAILAASAAPAKADNVAVVGHMSASVANTLSILEVQAIKFGNLIVNPGAAAGDATVTMTASGARSLSGANTDGVVLFHGASGAQATAGADDAGSQSPGFYNITGANSGAVIYVSFSEASGNTGSTGGLLIDANHPTNNVQLTGPGGNFFTADTFTVALDGGTGNTGTAATTPTYANGNYGQSVTLTGTHGTIRVGASLHTVAAQTYADGPYNGTFNIMVSY